MKPPATLITVDPGENYMAWAVFRNGALLICGLEDFKKGTPARRVLPQAQRASDLANLVVGAVSPYVLPGRPVHVLVEGQQTREGLGKKGDQQTLVLMALNSGFLLERLRWTFAAEHIAYIPPTSWKGSLKKDVMLRRITQELVRTGEYGNMGRKNEHTKDAAGIGLWYLGRI